MKVEILEIAGIYQAMKAMRLPMKSGDRTDSGWRECQDMSCGDCPYQSGAVCDLFDFNDSLASVGWKDHELSMNLIKGGNSHGKHLRLIDVWLEITAPRYFWSEFDTYKVGVDKISESTMHTILKDKVSLECFELGCTSVEDMTLRDSISETLYTIEDIKEMGIPDVDKIRLIKKLLPESFLQTRIVKCSYEVLRKIYQERKNHRLEEWRKFCEVLESLPYSEFITENFSEEVSEKVSPKVLAGNSFTGKLFDKEVFEKVFDREVSAEDEQKVFNESFDEKVSSESFPEKVLPELFIKRYINGSQSLTLTITGINTDNHKHLSDKTFADISKLFADLTNRITGIITGSANTADSNGADK